MESSQRVPPPRIVGRGPVILGVVLFCGFVAFALYKRERPPVPEVASEPNPFAEDPRRTFDTPFLNVRPEVQYVGDAACLNCHREICDTFHAHPMGRSLSSLREGTQQSPSTLGTFAAQDVMYEAKLESGRLVHREPRVRPMEARSPNARSRSAIRLAPAVAATLT